MPALGPDAVQVTVATALVSVKPSAVIGLASLRSVVATVQPG